MEIMTSTIQVNGEEGKSMDFFVAAPGGGDKSPFPLVIMEVFGVNAHIKDLAQRFAREGYVAATPDLTYRLEKRVAPNDNIEEAFAMRATRYDTKIVEDINRAIAYLKSRPDVKPEKVGITGYCFGGKVSWLAAC